MSDDKAGFVGRRLRNQETLAAARVARAEAVRELPAAEALLAEAYESGGAVATFERRVAAYRARVEQCDVEIASLERDIAANAAEIGAHA